MISTGENAREQILKLRCGHPEIDNRNGYWSDEDVKKLQKMFDEGIGISEIAVRMGRTEVSVSQRLLALGCFQPQTRSRKHKDPNEKKKTSKKPKCRCEKCGYTECLNQGRQSPVLPEYPILESVGEETQGEGT